MKITLTILTLSSLLLTSCTASQTSPNINFGTAETLKDIEYSKLGENNVEKTQVFENINSNIQIDSLTSYSVDEFGYTLSLPSDFKAEKGYQITEVKITDTFDNFFRLNINDPNINSFDIEVLRDALNNSENIYSHNGDWSIYGYKYDNGIQLRAATISNEVAYIISSQVVKPKQEYTINEIEQRGGFIKDFLLPDDLVEELNSLVTIVEGSTITHGTLQTAKDNNNPDALGRTLLTPELIQRYHEYGPLNCNTNFNSDEENEYVTYSNEKYSISFDIPYNSSWGNQKFWIEPFANNGDSVQFGPLTSFEACTWIRWYNFAVTDSRTPKEIEDALSELDALKQYTVGKYQVFEYTQLGLCDPHYYEIVEDDHNYVFNAVCGEIKNIDQIISTINIE